MARIENAVDICPYDGQNRPFLNDVDEEGFIILKPNEERTNLDLTIKKRNKDGWKLSHTNISTKGVNQNFNFIYLWWEREINETPTN